VSTLKKALWPLRWTLLALDDRTVLVTETAQWREPVMPACRNCVFPATSIRGRLAMTSRSAAILLERLNKSN